MRSYSSVNRRQIFQLYLRWDFHWNFRSTYLQSPCVVTHLQVLNSSFILKKKLPSETAILLSQLCTIFIALFLSLMSLDLRSHSNLQNLSIYPHFKGTVFQAGVEKLNCTCFQISLCVGLLRNSVLSTTGSVIPSFFLIPRSPWLLLINSSKPQMFGLSSGITKQSPEDHLCWTILQDFHRKETMWNKHVLISQLQYIFGAKLSWNNKFHIQTSVQVDSSWMSSLPSTFQSFSPF